ncbi:MAG: glycosyltransferase [Candidatus Pacebacteria bacterium]|nr:glycosyltransferase [Candidatus Paceibacterota bacterium]
MDSISVVLPAYNEAQTIVSFIQEVERELKKTKAAFEIVVVVDRSPDGTQDIVRAYADTQSTVKLFVRDSNRGLGNSIKLGVQKAKGTIIIGMDADFNHTPSTIHTLLKQLHNADLVVASRFVRGGGMTDIARYYPTYVANLLFRVLGMPIMDNTSGFYAIRKSNLTTLGLDAIYYGYGDYHFRLIKYAQRAGLRIREVPTYYGKRLGGQSKSRLLTMAWTYLQEVWRLRSV